MNSVVSKFYTKNQIERISNKNKLFGLSKHYDIYEVMFSHLLITLFLVVLLLLFKVNLLLGIVITLGYFFGAEYLFFDYRLRKRARKLEKESLFYFQILSLNLESGNNLRNAIELASNTIESNLSYEFRKVIDDILLGNSLNESLSNLKERIPSDIIVNIILNLIETNIYGSNIVESINNQIDYLSDKLLLEVKGRINKMPIKISLVSVVIFIPLIMLILLGPLVIKVVLS